MADTPLEALVGETRRTVEGFRVEAGKVAEFARATRDPAPVYRDAAAARDAGFDRTPAPPTFTRTAFFLRYRPDGVDDPLGFDLGFDREYVLHGEQSYAYDRPLLVGDELHADTTLADVFRRDGDAGGTMTFAVFKTTFRDADGDRVATARNTRIETDGPADDVASPTDDPASGDASVGVAEGDAGPPVEIGPLDRRDFVRYAVASGDFNPVHYDDPYATAAGHPSVFAQGMFSAGVLAGMVREWVGVAPLRSFRTRFTARAFPGDTLTARGRVAETEQTPAGRHVALDLAVLADDRTVVDGAATAVLP